MQQLLGIRTAILLFVLGYLLFGQITFTSNSATADPPLLLFLAGGPLGTATSTEIVTLATSGCYGHGFNYKSSFNIY